MTLARLLVAPLALCSLPAFAQDQQIQNSPLVSNAPAKLVTGGTRPDQISSDQLELEAHIRQLLESRLDRLRDEGPTCYMIRSYVVVRDSKDSDTTHPASHSTCQPATRYGVKTTEIRSATADH
jgi:hypothetical protein